VLRGAGRGLGTIKVGAGQHVYGGEFFEALAVNAADVTATNNANVQFHVRRLQRK
jgi:hypothetical protein